MSTFGFEGNADDALSKLKLKTGQSGEAVIGNALKLYAYVVDELANREGGVKPRVAIADCSAKIPKVKKLVRVPGVEC
jgi:hypothetical protein